MQGFLTVYRPRLWALLAGLLAGLPAGAATVQVAVQDGSGRPLSGAVVFLDSPEAKKLVRPAQGVEMAQQKRQFVPDLLVIPVGTEVRFPNNDTVRHHVYSFSPAKKFELKLYAGTPANPVLFDQPGVVVLGCNIHDQMVAWVLVVETPFHAQTSVSAPTARLEKVPAGAYKLRVWHAGLPVGAPAYEQALTVTEPGAAAPVVVKLQGTVQ
ncbi:MAG: methylamine utilization protein [Comamonadaceae bacterium]|nr:MAG: methylamine utilization protein [Comamonadaceae bacterium]